MTEDVTIVRRRLSDHLEIETTEQVLAVEEVNLPVLVTTPGPQGVSGPMGAAGSNGADGADGADGAPGEPGPIFAYVHDQLAPSATWTIAHNLSGFPNITVVDSGGTEAIGEVRYVDGNTVEVTFGAAFGGKAYLS